MIYFTIQEEWNVSVPIRGLFNLTYENLEDYIYNQLEECFRPHQGII